MDDNTTSDGCNNDWILTQYPLVKAIYVVTHFWTLSALAIFAKMIHDQVEIAHPVFAVIFQEVLVLLICETVGLIIMLCLVLDPLNNTLILLYSAPSYVALQFHQITWLIVTYLRYYLLIKKKPDDFVDVEGMTKRACILVWVTAIPFLICSYLLAYVPLAAKNFPDVSDLNDIDHHVLFGTILTSNIFYNTPDYISIVIYIKMSKRFRKRNKINQSNFASSAQTGKEGEDTHGGIWIGDVDEMAVDNGHEYLNVSEPQQPDESKMIMEKLGLHIFTSLLDMLCSLLIALLVRTVTGSIIGKVYLVAFCFWLPLLIIKSNVRQLDGMKSYLANIIRCKD